MWDSLTWWRTLRNPELMREVNELRQEALGFLVGLTMVAYLAWHIVRVPFDGSAELTLVHSLRHWALFAVAMTGLSLTIGLWRRHARLAIPWFLGTSLLSILAATWLFAEPDALMLVPILALIAVVLMHPLAGLAFGLVAMGLLLALWSGGPLAFVPAHQVAQVGILALLIVAVAWALGRILVRAIESSSASYADAWRHAEEARANRAELVKALKQLDHAYYRIQRSNAALELAWKAADAAERSKSEFVTNISHELRTPLNLIIGFSEMILTSPESYKAPLPVAYRGDLHAIYRGSQHLLTLTNDVIDLARVGMDRLAIVREPLTIGEIIQDACAIVRAYIETKGLALQISLEPDLPILHVDRLRVRQVLLNLLTNAARFTERGSITVAAAREGDWMQVTVIDTGDGIPPDQVPRVFDEFYHDGGDTAAPTERLGGVGLGLPLSRRLVELHGGGMGVDSTPGVGSRFWFRLPLLAPLGPGAPRQGAPGLGRLGDRAGGERILVHAEPAPGFLAFLRRHLTGYRIVEAPGLPEAVAAAAETRALAILASAGSHAPGDHPASPVPIISLPIPGAAARAAPPVVVHLVKPMTRAALYEALGQVPGPIGDILIVDDDRRFVRLLTRMLQAAPSRPAHAPRTAFDGRTALRLMEERPPDLMLLDLSLPEIDGAGLLAIMRDSPRLAEVPVIVISAQDQLLAEFPLHGALSVVKPDGLHPEELLRLIDGLVTLMEPPRPALTPTPDEGSGHRELASTL